ncbi:MAG TPA: hypothetical protein VF914_06015 [Chloroflexia bacterium]|jgi:hypothetical protein
MNSNNVFVVAVIAASMVVALALLVVGSSVVALRSENRRLAQNQQHRQASKRVVSRLEPKQFPLLNSTNGAEGSWSLEDAGRRYQEALAVFEPRKAQWVYAPFILAIDPDRESYIDNLHGIAVMPGDKVQFSSMPVSGEGAILGVANRGGSSYSPGSLIAVMPFEWPAPHMLSSYEIKAINDVPVVVRGVEQIVLSSSQSDFQALRAEFSQHRAEYLASEHAKSSEASTSSTKNTPLFLSGAPDDSSLYPWGNEPRSESDNEPTSSL